MSESLGTTARADCKGTAHKNVVATVRVVMRFNKVMFLPCEDRQRVKSYERYGQTPAAAMSARGL